MNSMIVRERLSSVIKPDSITSSQGDFLATHVPVKKLHLLNKFDVHPSGGDNYSEEEVFNKFILNPLNQHQFISVYGQSGTGKSHLIRWFETRFEQQKPENEVVLFIRRSDNTLKGTIRQLLEKPEVQEIANKEIYERLIRASTYLSENKLKDTIYHNFIIEIHNDDDSHAIKINNVKRKRLEAFLNNEVVHDYLMSENGPIERMYSKIAEHSFSDMDVIAQFIPEDFYVSPDLNESIRRAGADPKVEKMARELMSDVSGPENAKKLSDYLNQFVNDVIQRCAGIEPGDFRQIFQDIRRELFRLGKNLTLFIEDVTSFTGVDDALLDALIVEHTGMNTSDNICRISSIVGTTGNYLQNNFRDNHKDRITQYVYIPSDIFDQEGLYEFVGRYINTMSLSANTISSWLKNHANPEDYPVHEIVEGAGWENISIEFGKQLCLYPFTKNCINYLYKYRLTMGHQTPRYIIRDIIEPVVSDILNNKDSFPTSKFSTSSINNTLSYSIRHQVPDKAQADRLFRLLSIWGTGLPEQSTINEKIHIAGVPVDIIQELKLPIINLSEKTVSNKRSDDLPTEPLLTQTKKISENTQMRVNNTNKTLTNWTNQEPIDVSATIGTAGILRAAQADMCNYLFSVINWQAEGISIDNINKVKASKSTLLMFENQTKGHGFYTLPATWESMNIISAFIRWREYGKQSWDYPDSDFDTYLITSWTSKIKDSLIKVVDTNESTKISYIEAAVIAEIYRKILYGEYQENSLKNISTKHLFEQSNPMNNKANHSKEWLSLNSVLSQKAADKTNRDTIRRYFNIIQGEGSGSIVILNEPILTKILEKVKLNKLSVSETDLQLQDSVKLRKDIFQHLKDILDRINSVAIAEKSKAFSILEQVYKYFDDDRVDEDEIIELADLTKSFYSEVNNTQINIAVTSPQVVKNNSHKISKAISKISEVLDEEDILTVLMAFSGDPLSDLEPLITLISIIEADIKKVDNQLKLRKSTLGEVNIYSQADKKYQEELLMINGDITILSDLR